MSALVGLYVGFTVLVPLLSFVSISAAPPASKDDVLRYEVLKGLLVLQQQESTSDRPTCLDYNETGQLPLEEELSASEYADANFSPLVSIDSAGYKISQAEFRLPATLHGSSKMSCKVALTYAYGGGKYGGSGESMAVKRQNFIKEYYDTRPGSGPPYKLKANAKTKAYNDIRAYYNELISGREDSFRWWHDRILSQAFNTCWKWADPANPVTRTTPDSQRFNKDNWTKEQGGNKIVGATNEWRIEGAWQDSVVTCEGVRDYIFDTPENRFIMGFGEGALLENLEEATAEAERQQKIDNVTGLFLTSADGLNWCAASVGMLPSGRTANADFLQYIAEWLADGDGTPFVNPFNVDITIKNPNLDDPANPDANPGRTLTPHYSTAMFPDSSQAEITEIFTVFKDCLGTAYPTLEDALAVDFETPSVSRPGTNANGEAAPSCENDSGVLSWITCGVIDLISTTFNWVDTQIQALLGVDREKYTDENMYSVWAAIRNIAFAVLIIMMLVMVIGTAVGTQLFDAYTVKRAMPRMVAAILFISLSWYIVIAMIDLSNIVGNGVLGIMTSPFLDAGQVEAPTFASLFQGGGPGSGGAVGLAANVGGVGAALGITGAMFLIPGATGIILSWVGTGLLIIGIAFLVLVLRQMMIVALMIFAPIAILSWIFPGNDKLWKFWWSTFSKLLIMFPMIMALIAAGRIFSFSIATTSEGVLSFIIKISAYVIPYLMIPMTFKFAGGALANIAGMANDRSKGLFDRMKKGRQKNYHKAGGNLLQRRANMAGWMQNQGSSTQNWRGGERGGLSRRAFRTGGRILGAGNVEAAMSARNAEEGKIINDQINTGRDDAIRGLTVNKKAVDRARAEALRVNPHATSGEGWRVENGQLQYETLGGAWVSEAAVVEGHQRWGDNQFAQQAALSYEMRKVNTREQVEGLKENYRDLATQQWGLSERQASGNWIGAAFENQGLNMEYKHTNWETGETNVTKLADELYEKKGSYPMSQMHAHMFETLTDGYDAADEVTKQKINAISETFVQRYGSTGGGVAGMDGDSPIILPATPGAASAGASGGGLLGPDGRPISSATPQETARTVSGGAAAVGEAINELARKTGRLSAPPPENHRGPDSSQST